MSDSTSGQPKFYSEAELADALLAHLAERPQAMDTLEGIAEWWLLRQRVRLVVQQVERTLQQLTTNGILETVQSGAVTRYRLRRPDPEEVRPEDGNNPPARKSVTQDAT
jgi:hypothetical protein